MLNAKSENAGKGGAVSSKNKDIKDHTISAVGGAVGAGVGCLVGPEGSILGGLLGSVGAFVASKYAPDYLDSSILGRFLNNSKVEEILRQKIAADLSNGFLGSQGDLDQALESMRTLMGLAALEDPGVGTLEERLARGFKWGLPENAGFNEVWASNMRRLAEYCDKKGPLRIGCAAICPAVVAMFRDMNRRYETERGVKFNVRSNYINGREFFESLRSECDLDFAIGPLEALVFADEERKLPMKILGPIFGQQQHVYVSNKKRKHIRSGVWVFDRSSAKFQYHVGVGVPKSAEEQSFQNSREVPDLLESIPPGDMVVAWDPLSSVMKGRKDFTVVPQSNYKIHVVLLGHRSLLQKGAFPLQEFMSVLATEVRYQRNRHNSLFELLCSSQDFMETFAMAAGHRWTRVL